MIGKGIFLYIKPLWAPNFLSVKEWEPCIGCGSTKFGLGAEIQSPTGLFV